MDIIFVLIPIGLILLMVAIWAFRWALKSGQYDDLDSPAHRILFDDTPSEAASDTDNGTDNGTANRKTDSDAI